MLKYIVNFMLLYTFVYAIDVEMIDDTEETKQKIRKNEVAQDGKIIYKPQVLNSFTPDTTNTVKPMKSKVEKSAKR